MNKLTNPNGAATDTDVMQIKTNKDLMFSLWNLGIEWYDVLQLTYFLRFFMAHSTAIHAGIM